MHLLAPELNLPPLASRLELEKRVISCRDQDGRRMVSEEGTSICHRHLQRRIEYRRHHRAVDRTDHRLAIRLAMGVHRNRAGRAVLGVFLVAALSHAAPTSQVVGNRAGVYRKRPARSGRQNSLA